MADLWIGERCMVIPAIASPVTASMTFPRMVPARAVVREKMVRRITLVNFRMRAKLFLWETATNSHKARVGIVILTM